MKGKGDKGQNRKNKILFQFRYEDKDKGRKIKDYFKLNKQILVF